MNRLKLLLLSMLLPTPLLAVEAEYVDIPSGMFRSSVKYEENSGDIHVLAFSLMKKAVTHHDFLAFVERNPQWQKGQLSAEYAIPTYLEDWQSATELGANVSPQAPVTRVNWHAANAYCEEQGARLPLWIEWEYVAAADATNTDARDDHNRRTQLLYDGTTRAVDSLGVQARPNAYGVSQVHSAIWEWVENPTTILNRAYTSPIHALHDHHVAMGSCAAGALSFTDKEDYPVHKRVTVLSALTKEDTLGNLGFRCAKAK